ncbi:MAG: methyltransferase domain-containing protein [Lentisphaerae bacterium]|nr:methyltransferase domain-containing protein [Lentisphaerota bacterium]
MKQRSRWQAAKDFATFPLRALAIFNEDRWGLSSLRTDRFYYVGREVRGYCLDVGCCRYNVFINDFLNGNGKGIDCFPYEGLTEENLVDDLTHFPFKEATFDSVSFIASWHHIPAAKRDIELNEAYRVLRPGGNVIITSASPLAGILAHITVQWYDRLFRTRHNVDFERGMHDDEDYFVPDRETIERLRRAGFKEIRKKAFATQWFLNALFTGTK